jgi:D-lactate dehydrogenase (cytochrome)
MQVPSSESCPRVAGSRRVAAEFGGYLEDESRTTAEAVEVIYFPESIGHVCAAVRECARENRALTVTGARTGIVGGAVPLESKAVLALEKLNHIHAVRYDAGRDEFFARVEAGVMLAEFQEALRTTPAHALPWADEETRRAGERRIDQAGRRLFYPVDPTETSAQLGGTLSTNASGARTFYYGATRDWVEALTVVLASGDLLRLRRGETIASSADSGFVIETPEGRRRELPVPHLELPATKHQAGYHMAPRSGAGGVDAIDLFIGSEGTLGVIVEAELRLTFPPAERLFATAFLPTEARALQFVQEVRNRALRRTAADPGIPSEVSQDTALRPLAMEYIGPEAISLLRDKREHEGASSGVPPLSDDAGCAVYLELAFDGDEPFRRCYAVLEKLLRSAGTSAGETWAGFSPMDLDGMKAFRHAVPEHVNGIIGRRKRDVPNLHKVGTDMAVPDERLEDALVLYRSRLNESGLEHVIFGHIGDNHLHVNILPRSEEELERAMDLYREFADEVVKMGGSVAAEHGIGRLKKLFLPIQFDETELKAMEAVKKVLDPEGLLNPGVLF